MGSDGVKKRLNLSQIFIFRFVRFLSLVASSTAAAVKLILYRCGVAAHAGDKKPEQLSSNRFLPLRRMAIVFIILMMVIQHPFHQAYDEDCLAFVGLMMMVAIDDCAALLTGGYCCAVPVFSVINVPR